MSKILIIGGSGFLSGTLARCALAAGHEVWAVTRGKKPLPAGVRAIEADRKERNGFTSAIEAAFAEFGFTSSGQKWDLVVDCIGFEAADARQDIEVFRDKARHLVFVSTDFVFDPAHRKFPQNEESDFYLAQGYGGGKRQCELELMAADTTGMAWTILRPGHIYGPGSRLGCLPLHGRDPQLIAMLRAGKSLKLVGGGHFLQQPIFARDLAQLILGCSGNQRTYGEIYMAAGPDIIESRDYYRIVAEVLGVELKVEEISVSAYAAENPDMLSFLCHRIYDLKKLRAHGLAVPATPIGDGLREHVLSL